MTATSGDRIVVLDDDPTGTQTVSDISIVLNPDEATLSIAATASAGPVWILTNTRAMSWDGARPCLEGIVERVRSVFGRDTQLILRGDSTLRGHVLGEIDVLSTEDSVALLVPAFVEQGRITLGGIHYVTIDGVRVEVGSTEYARDAAFAYTTSDLVRWVDDRESGRPAIGMPLEVLRTGGAQAVATALLSAPARSVIVPDVETTEDLKVIRDGWVAAQHSGRHVVLRCAASMASVATGSSARVVSPTVSEGPVLVVCGSHTQGATEQLAALGDDGVARHEIDTTKAIGGGADDYLHKIVAAIDATLRAGQVTVVCTPRVADATALGLAGGEAIMDFVVAIVRGLDRSFPTVVTKGGITSARIARDALSAPLARVRGQVLPGIPLWTLQLSGGATMQQVVVPGNIGDRTALQQIVAQLNPTSR